MGNYRPGPPPGRRRGYSVGGVIAFAGLLAFGMAVGWTLLAVQPPFGRPQGPLEPMFPPKLVQSPAEVPAPAATESAGIPDLEPPEGGNVAAMIPPPNRNAPPSAARRYLEMQASVRGALAPTQTANANATAPTANATATANANAKPSATQRTIAAASPAAPVANVVTPRTSPTPVFAPAPASASPSVSSSEHASLMTPTPPSGFPSLRNQLAPTSIPSPHNAGAAPPATLLTSGRNAPAALPPSPVIPGPPIIPPAYANASLSVPDNGKGPELAMNVGDMAGVEVRETFPSPMLPAAPAIPARGAELPQMMEPPIGNASNMASIPAPAPSGRRESSGMAPERPVPLTNVRSDAEVASRLGNLIDAIEDPEAEFGVVVGRTKIMRLRNPLKRISIADPEIAAIQFPPTQGEVVLDPENGDDKIVSVLGRKYGTTSLTLWDHKDQPITFLVRVTLDALDIEARLKKIYPDANIKLSQMENQIVLEGQVPDSKSLTEIAQLVSGAAAVRGKAGEAGPQVINRLHVPGPRQVMLRVKIAELNRGAIRKMGVNLCPNPGAGSQQNFGIFAANKFDGFLQALRSNNMAKILAEPVLVTMDGQPAKFEAGGQFPYPVAQGDKSQGITIQYRSFGTTLSFTPHIQAQDIIRLDVEPTFSQLNPKGGTSVGGVAVPGINQRSARTVVELREGQTLALAGLLQTSHNAQTDRVPVLGDLPVVGNAFRKSRVETVETELVVLVTPVFVAPMDPEDVPPLPGADVQEPTGKEFFKYGRTERRVTEPNYRSTTDHLDPFHKMPPYTGLPQYGHSH